MPASASPTISIYQNPDHVAGILQQIHLSPLVTSESREQGSQRTDTERKDRSGQADVKASANVPGIGSIGGGVGAARAEPRRAVSARRRGSPRTSSIRRRTTSSSSGRRCGSGRC